MRVTATIVLSLIALNLAGSANAADKVPEAQRIRQMADRYAACVIARSSSQARRFVVEEGNPPINGQCLVNANKGSGGQLRFPGQNYRYALAGALLPRDYPTGVPGSIRTAPDLPHSQPAPLDEATLPKDSKKADAAREAYTRRHAVWVMDVLGECTARADPDASYELVRSAIGSLAERAAFDRLKPAIGGCLPEDATLRLDAGMLRGTIALNLYRLAYSVRKPDHA